MFRVLTFVLFLSTSLETVAESDPLPKVKIQKIAEGVYQHTSYQRFAGWGLVASNGLVAIVGNDAYIIDTPSTEESTLDLIDWIKKHDFDLKGSLSTHFHEDSAIGIPHLNHIKIPTFASKLTNDLLKMHGKEQAAVTFAGKEFEWVPNQIEVFYPGPGHSIDNVVVYLPQQQLLFGGCFVKEQSLGNLEDADIARWPKSAQRLLNRYQNARIVIPGHGSFSDTRLLKSTLELSKQKLEQSNTQTP